MKKSDDYESMLSEGLEQLPASVKTKSRFEMPKVTGHVEGNKTIVSNFFQIAKALNVDSKHLMKYFIQTFGCQMNLSDSERICAILEHLGFEKVAENGYGVFAGFIAVGYPAYQSDQAF